MGSAIAGGYVTARNDMANPFRRLLRKLLDRELGVVGDELSKLQARHDDLTTQLEAFEVRFERVRARVGMRVTRANREDYPNAPRDEFERLLQRERGHGAQTADLGDDDWVDFNRLN